MTSQEHYKNMVTIAISQDLKSITPGLTAKVQGAFDNRSYFTERRHKMPNLYSSRKRNTSGELIMTRRVNAYGAQYSSTETNGENTIWRQMLTTREFLMTTTALEDWFTTT